jgi:hypothetical protein
VIDPEALRPFRGLAPDHDRTEHLKVRFRELRKQRKPFYLKTAELEDIFDWKLDGQYGRVARYLRKNTDSGYESITRAAFAINEDDVEYEARLRLGVLISLRGVDTRVASAILALVDPDRYCVIDFRGWRAAFRKKKLWFGIKDYLQYLREVREVSLVLGWCPQEVDEALWVYDKRKSRP